MKLLICLSLILSITFSPLAAEAGIRDACGRMTDHLFSGFSPWKKVKNPDASIDGRLVRATVIDPTNRGKRLEVEGRVYVGQVEEFADNPSGMSSWYDRTVGVSVTTNDGKVYDVAYDDYNRMVVQRKIDNDRPWIKAKLQSEELEGQMVRAEIPVNGQYKTVEGKLSVKTKMEYPDNPSGISPPPYMVVDTATITDASGKVHDLPGANGYPVSILTPPKAYVVKDSSKLKIVAKDPLPATGKFYYQDNSGKAKILDLANLPKNFQLDVTEGRFGKRINVARETDEWGDEVGTYVLDNEAQARLAKSFADQPNVERAAKIDARAERIKSRIGIPKEGEFFYVDRQGKVEKANFNWHGEDWYGDSYVIARNKAGQVELRVSDAHGLSDDVFPVDLAKQDDLARKFKDQELQTDMAKIDARTKALKARVGVPKEGKFYFVDQYGKTQVADFSWHNKTIAAGHLNIQRDDKGQLVMKVLDNFGDSHVYPINQDQQRALASEMGIKLAKKENSFKDPIFYKDNHGQVHAIDYDPSGTTKMANGMMATTHQSKDGNVQILISDKWDDAHFATDLKSQDDLARQYLEQANKDKIKRIELRAANNKARLNIPKEGKFFYQDKQGVVREANFNMHGKSDGEGVYDNHYWIKRDESGKVKFSMVERSGDNYFEFPIEMNRQTELANKFQTQKAFKTAEKIDLAAERTTYRLGIPKEGKFYYTDEDGIVKQADFNVHGKNEFGAKHRIVRNEKGEVEYRILHDEHYPAIYKVPTDPAVQQKLVAARKRFSLLTQGIKTDNSMAKVKMLSPEEYLKEAKKIRLTAARNKSRVGIPDQGKFYYADEKGRIHEADYSQHRQMKDFTSWSINRNDRGQIEYFINHGHTMSPTYIIDPDKQKELAAKLVEQKHADRALRVEARAANAKSRIGVPKSGKFYYKDRLGVHESDFALHGKSTGNDYNRVDHIIAKDKDGNIRYTTYEAGLGDTDSFVVDLENQALLATEYKAKKEEIAKLVRQSREGIPTKGKFYFESPDGKVHEQDFAIHGKTTSDFDDHNIVNDVDGKIKYIVTNGSVSEDTYVIDLAKQKQLAEKFRQDHPRKFNRVDVPASGKFYFTDDNGIVREGDYALHGRRDNGRNLEVVRDDEGRMTFRMISDLHEEDFVIDAAKQAELAKKFNPSFQPGPNFGKEAAIPKNFRTDRPKNPIYVKDSWGNVIEANADTTFKNKAGQTLTVKKGADGQLLVHEVDHMGDTQNHKVVAADQKKLAEEFEAKVAQSKQNPKQLLHYTPEVEIPEMPKVEAKSSLLPSLSPGYVKPRPKNPVYYRDRHGDLKEADADRTIIDEAGRKAIIVQKGNHGRILVHEHLDMGGGDTYTTTAADQKKLAEEFETRLRLSERKPAEVPAVEVPVMPKVSGQTMGKEVASPIKLADIPSEVKAAKVIPRGSAIATSSGELERQGIKQIIHAATGAMEHSGPNFAPTLQGVTDSVKNSIALAKANGHKRVAIPFIGGKIFLEKIGVSSKELAEAIVKNALEASDGIEVRFASFGPEDTQTFKDAVAKFRGKRSPQHVDVVSGDITQGSLHGASVIVNAANMEVKFGGGLSGVIGRATGQADKIDQEAAKQIEAFYKQTDVASNPKKPGLEVRKVEPQPKKREPATTTSTDTVLDTSTYHPPSANSVVDDVPIQRVEMPETQAQQAAPEAPSPPPAQDSSPAPTDYGSSSGDFSSSSGGFD